MAQKWHTGTGLDCTHGEALVELASMAPLGPPPPTSDRVQFHVWNLKRERMMHLAEGPWKPEGILLDGANIYVDPLASFGGDQVYFVECPSLGRVKIGVTNDMAARFKSLASTSPTGDLLLLIAFPGNRDVEQRLHQAFAAHRLHSEWFQFAPEIRACIEHLERHIAARSGSDVDLAREPDSLGQGDSRARQLASQLAASVVADGYEAAEVSRA